MSNFSIIKNPKIFISNHFDSLIREIDIEERLECYKTDKQITVNYGESKQISPIKIITDKNIDDFMNFEAVEDFHTYGREKIWNFIKIPDFNFDCNLLRNKSKHIKAIDYWNGIRDELLAELNQFQKQTFEYYDTIIRKELKSYNSQNKDIESIMSRVFEKKNLFILNYEHFDTEEHICLNMIHLIEFDFYLNQNERELLR